MNAHHRRHHRQKNTHADKPFSLTLSSEELVTSTGCISISEEGPSIAVHPDSYDNSVHWMLNAIGGKPLVVALVGLPGRGKSIISTKLKRWLIWNKIYCQVFHLCMYRRKIAPNFPEHVLDDPLRMCETEFRSNCMQHLFNDLAEYFSEVKQNMPLMKQPSVTSDELFNRSSQSDVPRGDVAIFDGANTLRSQRDELRKFCAEQNYDLFFIETVTFDPQLIELYILGIEKSNPDYMKMTREEAVAKFRNHSKDYAETYEQLETQVDADISFIKIFDGGSRYLVHNMAGYIQSKMVYYLMNLHFHRQPIYLTRHGEALNNVMGLIGGDTDLTAQGVQYADALADYINNLDEVKHPDKNRHGLQIWTSVLKRAQQTAARVQSQILCWKALQEIDAGIFDGRSYEEIKQKYPYDYERRLQDKFRYRYPEGESYDDLVTRLEPVIMELERTRSTIVIVCHQAVLRCLLAYFLDKSFDELPYINTPLHHLFKITPHACGYKVEDINFHIPSNDFTSMKVKNEKGVVRPLPRNQSAPSTAALCSS